MNWLVHLCLRVKGGLDKSRVHHWWYHIRKLWALVLKLIHRKHIDANHACSSILFHLQVCLSYTLSLGKK